jgi:hypothetical protein
MSYKQSKDLLEYSMCPKDNPIKTPVYYTKLPSVKKSDIPPPTPTPTPSLPASKKIKVDYVEQDHENTGSPEIWGPAYWFGLHNAASKYPGKATPLWKERMKNYILGIPVSVPCEKCSVHATAYIENHYNDLDSVVSGRDNLVEFFCTFHNYVSKRLGKPEMKLEDVIELYSSPAKVTKLQLSFE